MPITTSAPSHPSTARPAPLLLIVDDDRLVLATLGRGLRDAGFQVLEADSGERALEIVTQHRPALALIDQQMPGLSGVQVAQQLTGENAVPFIFLTASAEPDIVNTALHLGALAYLVKPLDLPQVIPTVRAALRRASEIEGLRTQMLQLSAALKQGREISTAIGLVMGRLSLTQDEALERLRQHARNTRVRMEDLAKVVIADQEESSLLYKRLAAVRSSRSADFESTLGE
jgi:response regulator NasT